MSDMMTNFTAADMPGAKKPEVFPKVAPAKPAKAPRVSVPVVTEPVVEEVVVEEPAAVEPESESSDK